MSKNRIIPQAVVCFSIIALISNLVYELQCLPIIIAAVVLALVGVVFTKFKNGFSIIISVGALLLSFAPDPWIANYHLPSDAIPYQQVDFSDFKADTITKAHLGSNAVISTNYNYHVNLFGCAGKVRVTSVMQQNDSWFQSDKVGHARLLNHEQLHFDITELHRHKMLDSINRTTWDSEEELAEIFQHFIRLKNVEQDFYDDHHPFDSTYYDSIRLELKSFQTK